ncbi:inosine triphosphate pyrophosphatase-like protein, partial [Fimicolochytrium jonesii]|uniref:inosine triphosphate pyrophosphatase-like protein n=1 Tax=Fimicolochytrium jonesii TaxID=1396493 RepID=UPI0022FF1A50
MEQVPEQVVYDTHSFKLPIILGSSSKFRATILRQHNVDFTVLKPDLDEKAVPGRDEHDPSATALAIAHAKAAALASQIPAGTPPSLVITTDQVVGFAGTVREKPESADECRHYIKSYEEAPAETHSAVVVTNTKTGKRVAGVDVARQYFASVPNEVVDELIRKGDVMHSCGGFVVDDPLLHPYLLAREGDEDSIIGMPMKLLMQLLKEAEEEM